jgi:hypothetical protein
MMAVRPEQSRRCEPPPPSAGLIKSCTTAGAVHWYDRRGVGKKGGCAGVAGMRGLCGVLCLAAYLVDLQVWVLGFRHQLTRSYH